MKRSDYGAEPFAEQWLWSLSEDGDGDGLWTNYAGDRDAAIGEAMANRTEEDRFTDYVYVAKSLEYNPSISASSILEDLASEAYDECGEAAEDAFTATPEQEADLQTMLNQTLGTWLTKHNLWPSFSRLGPVEKIPVAIGTCVSARCKRGS